MSDHGNRFDIELTRLTNPDGDDPRDLSEDIREIKKEILENFDHTGGQAVIDQYNYEEKLQSLKIRQRVKSERDATLGLAFSSIFFGIIILLVYALSITSFYPEFPLESALFLGLSVFSITCGSGLILYGILKALTAFSRAHEILAHEQVLYLLRLKSKLSTVIFELQNRASDSRRRID